MAEYKMISSKIIRAWLISYLALLFLVVGSYWYAYNNAKKLCGVVSLNDETYKQLPPPSPTGKLMAKEIDKLRRSYHCK